MISVIVPVYNVEAYLHRCIDSILNQSYKDFELILVDDGSEDHSGEICDEYGKYENVKVIHQTNHGVSAARNAGLEQSRGEYILFVDADDWLAEDALEKMIHAFYDESIDMVICSSYTAMEKEDHSFEYIDGITWDYNAPHKVEDKYREVLAKTGTLWNKLLKKETIGNVRFHPEMTYGEDCVFVSEFLVNCNGIIILPDQLYYYYRNRKGNVVSAEINERSLEFLSNMKQIYELMVKWNRPEVGICREMIGVNEVISKIPVSLSNTFRYRKYYKACKNLLKKCDKEGVKIFLNSPDISDSRKQLYRRICYFPFFFYARALKSELRKLIKH